MSHFKLNYARVRSNCLADTTCDPVAQHMRAWRIFQHELKIQRAKPWENCHVNPGRQQPNKQICSPNPLRSFSRLSLQPANVSRSPSSLRSLQPNKKSARISYSAHTESHKKHGDFNKEVTFKPKILDTCATSKLIQSRNYQAPKKKTRPDLSVSKAPSNEAPEKREEEQKSWSRRRSESTNSSSTGCDSAYEAGGSIEALSPHSRSSTPQPVTIRSAKVDKDVEESRLAGKEIEEAIEEMIDRPGSPVNLIDRNESLDYILFEHDLMNEIASCGVLTNFSVREICRSFTFANANTLAHEKVQEIVERVQKLLGIPENNDLDFSDFGLHSNLESSDQK